MQESDRNIKIILRNLLTVQLLYGLCCLLQEANKEKQINDRMEGKVWEIKMTVVMSFGAVCRHVLETQESVWVLKKHIS